LSGKYLSGNLILAPALKILEILVRMKNSGMISREMLVRASGLKISSWHRKQGNFKKLCSKCVYISTLG
jgi:hypothetical protein